MFPCKLTFDVFLYSAGAVQSPHVCVANYDT